MLGSMRWRTPSIVASSILLALAVGCSTSPRSSVSAQEPRRGTNRPGLHLSREQGPFIHGVKVSLDQAQAQAPFPIFRPKGDLADDALIRAVYIEQQGGDVPMTQVAVDYESGILLTLSPASVPLERDAASFWARKVAENRGMTVETVLGNPALVVQRDIERTGNPASIAFVISGIQVTIYGAYAPVSADALKQIAESVSA